MAAGYAGNDEAAQKFRAEFTATYRTPVSIHKGNVGEPGDCRRTIEEVIATQMNLSRLAAHSLAPPPDWRRRLAQRAYRNARKLHRARSAEGRLNQARWAVRLAPTPRNLWLWLRARVGAIVS